MCATRAAQSGHRRAPSEKIIISFFEEWRLGSTGNRYILYIMISPVAEHVSRIHSIDMYEGRCIRYIILTLEVLLIFVRAALMYTVYSNS